MPPEVSLLDGVLERVTFANPETGYTIARIGPAHGGSDLVFCVAAATMGGHSRDAAGPIWYATHCDPALHPDATFTPFAKLTQARATQLRPGQRRGQRNPRRVGRHQGGRSHNAHFGEGELPESLRPLVDAALARGTLD